MNRPDRSSTEQEELFRLMVDSIQDYAIFMLDAEGRVVSWNKGAERIKGFQAGEILGRPLSQFYTPEDIAVGRPDSELKRAAQDGRFVTEGWRIRKDGTRFWARATLTALKDDQGNLRGFAKVTSDLSERDKKDAIWRGAIESAPNVALIMTNRRGEIVLANLQAEKLFGYGREELLGRSIEILVPTRFREKHPGFRQGFYADARTRPMGAGRHLYGLRKDGSEVPVEIGLNPLSLPEGMFVLSSIIDISERKKGEERFRLAVEASPAAMIMVDQEGRTVLVNAQAEKLFGYARTELLGQSIENLIPGALDGKGRGADGGPNARSMDAPQDLHGVKKDGTRFPIQLGLNPIGTADGNFVLAAVVDITERKNLESRLASINEELERLVRQRTALAESRATKLRELATRLAMTEQRERQHLAQILHDHLQQLLVAARLGVSRLHQPVGETTRRATVAHVEALIDESLKASRDLTVELSPPLLRDAGLAAALEWLARWMKEKHGLKVRVEAEANPESPSEERKVLVFQTVRELLFNVVKHAGTDQAMVRIGGQDAMVRIVVEDRGRGFDPDSVLAGPRAEGGFGLQNARERLEMLGCSMTIASRSGKGTVVTIEVPVQELVPAAASATVPESKVAPARAKGAQRIRVMVVDDHTILRQGLIRALQDCRDIDVIGEAGNGREALAKALAFEPDVVVMDITMPDMNGIEATQRIKEAKPAIKVIGLSIHEAEDIAKTMIRAGATAYLSKSGPVDELINAIRRAWRGVPAPRVTG